MMTSEEFLKMLGEGSQGQMSEDVNLARRIDEARVSPSRIGELAANEIFVFGSNAKGLHGGGAAAAAMRRYGAVWGQGEGLQGRSYAVPTMEGLASMKRAVQRFTQFAAVHPEMRFLVTRIGCGIAGYSAEQVAPMFKECVQLENVALPSDFWKVLGGFNKKKTMHNLLLSAAIGDIAGMPYEGFEGRTKRYDAVDLLLPYNTYTDDTVCTFACAEALLKGLDMAENLWTRGRADFYRGFGGRFARWLMAREVTPSYHSYGNGSGMRVSAAGFMADSVEECIELATRTALPTHDHPEGIKGAVATALAIFYGMEGKDKSYVRRHVLEQYYPDWGGRTYDDIQPEYKFDATCQQTIPAALICFLESRDYVDCLKLSIALGGDADTLAAISGPMAYAYYREMPEELVANAKAKLPKWMLDVNDACDEAVARRRGWSSAASAGE